MLRILSTLTIFAGASIVIALIRHRLLVLLALLALGLSLGSYSFE
jgi:hypothetical protein